ncbi:MAG: serine hydrolase [Bacteroidales bacterium]|jgi:beta-glucosidase-like glycosyl hydrolase/CubicO group peptidase (beta-lactamase class C family)|nr:serine hydrolase [Bacteroidales bacterium]
MRSYSLSSKLHFLLFANIFLFSFTIKVECQNSDIKKDSNWAEQQIKKMTLEEKIAQIIFIRIHSNKDAQYNAQKIKEIEKYQPGGVCFFQGGPIREINITNKIQAVSKIPLLVSMDAEWGVAMRLDSTPVFPKQMTLGALSADNDELIYKFGTEVANQCKLLGINLNFAPCVDVNNNAKNPVINSRSFGENRELVVKKALQYMNGMQTHGVIACAKHFPGHGDTETDSHYSLPIIKKTKEQLWNTELYPFIKMIENGCEMIMTSHLNIPALDNEPGSIATTSYKIVTDLLRNEMGFSGIIITDGMEMEGLRKTYPNGADAEIKCLQAGIDALLLPNELNIIIPLIKKAVEDGEISEKSIDEKCLKLLLLKEKWNICSFQPLNPNHIIEKLNDKTVTNLINEIETKSLTLVKNDRNLLPLKSKEKKCILFIGDTETEKFSKKICEEYHLPFISIDKNIRTNEIPTILTKFSLYEEIIVIYLSTNQTPSKNYGITKESVAFLNELGKSKTLILSLFGNPYALAQFNSLSRFDAVIVGYQRTENSTRATIQAIFGELPFEGLLPVSVLNYQAQTNTENRTFDANYRMSEKKSQEINFIIEKGIKEKVFPGCQVWVSKNGEPLYVKSYGTTDYTDEAPVTSQTLYDVASITKPLATTLAVMKLYDDGKLFLKDTIGKYLQWLVGSNKSSLRIEELLTHTSGLQAFIPFYKELLSDSMRYIYFNDIKTETYSIPVAHKLFLNHTYIDTIRKIVSESNLKPKKYLYSDLGFLFLKEMVETITQKSCEDYVYSEFYEPLGLSNTYFNPILKGVGIEKIAPTEKDTLFRKQIVKGYVHDQTAALFGGFAGNAGLFSTAHDLAVILEMLMNEGVYNGKRFLSEKTVQLFTSSYSCNNSKRRALGFDTPSADKSSDILPARASTKTFGHQGFTGTAFWCDPKENLIYIFLSNRVFPNAEPNLLSKSKIRLLVHEKIYETF